MRVFIEQCSVSVSCQISIRDIRLTIHTHWHQVCNGLTGTFKRKGSFSFDEYPSSFLIKLFSKGTNGVKVAMLGYIIITSQKRLLM